MAIGRATANAPELQHKGVCCSKAVAFPGGVQFCSELASVGDTPEPQAGELEAGNDGFE